jgi:hypothetical protein
MEQITGTADRDGTITFTWNMQAYQLLSPDGTQQLLPCEHCGQPQWVRLNVVSILCDICATVALHCATDDLCDACAGVART